MMNLHPMSFYAISSIFKRAPRVSESVRREKIMKIEYFTCEQLPKGGKKYLRFSFVLKVNDDHFTADIFQLGTGKKKKYH